MLHTILSQAAAKFEALGDRPRVSLRRPTEAAEQAQADWDDAASKIGADALSAAWAAAQNGDAHCMGYVRHFVSRDPQAAGATVTDAEVQAYLGAIDPSFAGGISYLIREDLLRA